MRSRSASLVRARDGAHAGRVSFLELFYDLVFVFAVTQLSHYLLDHLSLTGALQTSVMFLAVWWAWVYTAWATNWLDPDRAPVRLVLVTVMLASMVLAASMKGAFHRLAVAEAVSPPLALAKDKAAAGFLSSSFPEKVTLALAEALAEPTEA